MAHTTRHMAAQMSRRAIRRDLVDLTCQYGEIDQDKRILNRKGLQHLLAELRQFERMVIRAIDKGGVVVVEADGELITTYRADSFHRRGA